MILLAFKLIEVLSKDNSLVFGVFDNHSRMLLLGKGGSKHEDSNPTS